MALVTPHEIQALHELSQRQCDSLDIFRPMQNQEPYYLSGGTEILLRGGNRSSCEGTILWKCERGNRGGQRSRDYKLCRVEDIEVGDTIVGTIHTSKRRDIAPAIVKSIDVYPESTYRLTTKRGYELEGTHDHPVFACPPLPPRYNNAVDPDYKKGQWVLLRDLQPGWFVAMAMGGYIGWSGGQHDESYFHGLMDGDGSVRSKHSTPMSFAAHQDETLLDWVSEYINKETGGVSTQHRIKGSKGASLEWCSRYLKDRYIEWTMPGTPEAMSSYVRGLFDADGCVTTDGKIVLIQKDTERVRLIQNLLLMFGIKCSTHLSPANLEQKRPNPIWRLQIGGFSVKRYAESIGFCEEEKIRKLDAIVGGRRKPPTGRLWWDRVEQSAPSGESKTIYAISTSLETYISNGIVSHNSGKSTCVAAKFAAIARDKCITLQDGRRVRMRRPYQRGKKLTMWVIAYDSKYVGQTIHRLLFRPGLFRIIRDSKTGEWVTFKPRNADHASRKNEVAESPPLIPESWVAPGSWDWDNLGNHEFKRVEIVHPQTGEELAEIYAFSSKGDPKAGDPVDHIWIDEKIRYPRHYGEWQARILDRNGRIDWSSWPAMGNSALTDLTKRAKKCKESGGKRVQEIILRTDQNEHFSREEFREWASGFSEEEFTARVSGEYQTDGLRMYPLFSKETCSAIIRGGNEDDLSVALRRNGLQPPPDWTRELVLDPGTTNPAVLFCAIPPPHFGNYYVVFNEICIPRLDAKRLAQAVKKKMGDVLYQRFIIDPRAGRQTPMGFNITIMQNYAKEFERAGVFCKNTGSSFSLGSDQVAARIQVLQEWTHIQSATGLPKLRIVTDTCPNLCEQLAEYEKQMTADIVQDFVASRGQVLDAAVCLEYWASRAPQYIAPPPVTEGKAQFQAVWDDFKRRYFNKKKTPDDNAIIMGPPS